ncbi:hypothetical protein B0J14DRAFT_698831 [Halenospora varia]|nr:hypothetical protein B0J14DRAFT_698831 [Halenospora varia]
MSTPNRPRDPAQDGNRAPSRIVVVGRRAWQPASGAPAPRGGGPQFSVDGQPIRTPHSRSGSGQLQQPPPAPVRSRAGTGTSQRAPGGHSRTGSRSSLQQAAPPAMAGPSTGMTVVPVDAPLQEDERGLKYINLNTVLNSNISLQQAVADVAAEFDTPADELLIVNEADLQWLVNAVENKSAELDRRALLLNEYVERINRAEDELERLRGNRG